MSFLESTQRGISAKGWKFVDRGVGIELGGEFRREVSQNINFVVFQSVGEVHVSPDLDGG